MPSNWLAFDNNFPTFTGEESPEQQIRALHNYLYQLREGLQYSLQNLSAKNFNATALRQMTTAQKQELGVQLQEMYTVLDDLGNEVAALSEQVGGLQERTDTAETSITALKGRMTLAEGNIETLAESVSGEGGLQERTEAAETAIEALAGAVQVAEDGSATVGTQGKALKLVGDVYINGVLYTGGTA